MFEESFRTTGGIHRREEGQTRRELFRRKRRRSEVEAERIICFLLLPVEVLLVTVGGLQKFTVPVVVG